MFDVSVQPSISRIIVHCTNIDSCLGSRDSKSSQGPT